MNSRRTESQSALARDGITVNLYLTPHERTRSYYSAKRIRVAVGCYVYECDTPSEAVSAIRDGVRRVKAERGRRAVQSQWVLLCDDQAGQARLVRTACDLLRDPKARKLVYEIVRDGRKYSADLDYYATRKVVTESREIIAEREQRRSETTPGAETGRIGKLCAPQQVAARLATGKHKRSWIRQQLQRPEVLEHLTVGTIAEAASKCHLGRRQRAALARYVAGRNPGDAGLRLIVETIGEIGEQAERDLDELREAESLSGKQGRNHYFEKSVVDRVQLNDDLTAALITIADIKSWGAYGYGGAEGYGKQSGCGYRVYLIVRDATRGTAHVLRVPPKFGNPDRQFYGKFDSDDARIEAAREWTFGERSLAGAVEV